MKECTAAIGHGYVLNVLSHLSLLVSLLFLFFRRGKWGTERSNTLHKVLRLVRGETRMHIQEAWLQSGFSFSLHDSPYLEPAEYFCLVSPGERMTIAAVANRVHHVCKLWLLCGGCLELWVEKDLGLAGGGWLMMSAIQDKDAAAGLWTTPLKCLEPGLAGQLHLSWQADLPLPRDQPSVPGSFL